jgi:DNA-binding NarL/FixJ family response regulator
MKKGCALLADMHHNMLEGIRGLLETMFSSVVMVADYDSMVEAAKKLNPDLTVVDLSLHSEEEVNISRQFKKLYPNLKFIVLSIHDEKIVVEKILADGANGFVLKRRAAKDLLKAADLVMKGESFISPTIN